MDEEDDLQNRYDSIFLSFPIVPFPSFHHQHNIDTSDRKTWPNLTQLPSLPKAYHILETFILDGKNWNVKKNSQNELRMIEEKLNDLISCLQYEKIYGKKYWEKSQRSIQASIVHFYIFLKTFIWILIPSNHNSLLHANSSSKLLVEIVRLEQLVNEIIQLMKSIHQFMFKEQFQEEKALTQEFFKEMLEFIKEMPKINKKSLMSVPKIMNFINICLSLDPQRLSQHQNQLDFAVQYYSRKDSYNQTEKRISNKSFTLSQQSVRKQSFKFQQRSRFHTIINRKHSINTSLTKQRSQSQQKSRSPSIQRSFTLFQQQRLKRGTSNSIQTSNRDRDNTKINGRSRLMTSKTNHSKGSKQKDHKKHFQKEDLELQREGKVKIKKKGIPTLKIKTVSYQINLDKGVCKGWGLIRQYLMKKIAERKLKKLLIF